MKTVIVTGAAGNLGRAVVKKFIAEGYNVIGTITKKVTEDIFPKNQFEPHVVNLTNETESVQFAENLISKYNTIDTAVLTVGGFVTGKIVETSIADINQQIQLNFNTAYNVARPVFKQMLKQKTGRIFLIGSQPGLSSANSKGMVAYGLSKSLLFRLAELMNAEAKGTNVVTAVVVPGTIDTPQNRQAMPGAAFDKWVKPESIADIIYYYATDTTAILSNNIIKV